MSLISNMFLLPGIMTNMNIQQLNDAIRRRNITELQRAYRECRGAGLTPRDAPQMSKARQTIEILSIGNSKCGKGSTSFRWSM